MKVWPSDVRLASSSCESYDLLQLGEETIAWGMILTNKFKDIDFGASAAENEIEDNPELLLTGYFDLQDSFNKVIRTRKFLVLGYKGSGKSALAQHLALTAHDNYRSVRIEALSQFPFNEFASGAGRPDEWQFGYTNEWSVYLLVQLIGSFQMDRKSNVFTKPEIAGAVTALKNSGLLPIRDLRDAVRAHVDWPEGSAVRMREHLQLVLPLLRSSISHILVVDGLDEVLDPSIREYRVLNSLIEAASSLNNLLIRNGVPAKVVVLCRTDLFDRMPGPNRNKLKQDRAVELNWYEHTLQPRNSRLVRLVDRKAGVSVPQIENTLGRFFPTNIGHRPTVDVLLDQTRHTPRDFLRLLACIQEFSPDDPRRVRDEDVKHGMRKYSNSYFGSEIENELSGFVSDDEIAKIVRVIAKIGIDRFYRPQVEAVVRRSEPGLDVERIFSRLFECSAIGCVARTDRTRDRQPRFAFRYRNANVPFNFESQLLVHPGWRPFLNLTTPKSRPNDESQSVVRTRERPRRSGRPNADVLESRTRQLEEASEPGERRSNGTRRTRPSRGRQRDLKGIPAASPGEISDDEVKSAPRVRVRTRGRYSSIGQDQRDSSDDGEGQHGSVN